MKALQKMLHKNSLFYTVCVLVLFVMAVFLCLLSQGDGFILLNSFHTKSLNYIFEIITFFGDGTFILCLSLIITAFFKKHRKLAFLMVFSYLLSGLSAQVFKALISAPRPSVYFTKMHYKYYLDTFANSRVGYKSFPSGHAASAFAMATIISIYAKRKPVCVVALAAALLIGFSRIYLAHHFLMDVFGGAIIGVTAASLSTIWFKTFNLKVSKKGIFKNRKKQKAMADILIPVEK